MVKRTYQPSIKKRKKRTGFRIRMRTIEGRQILRSRRKKRRRRLTN